MTKKIIVANWKMNPQSLAEARDLLEHINEYLGTIEDRGNFSLVICPPFVFTEEVGKVIQSSSLKHHAFLGAQDIAWEDAGPDTGEISGPMLEKLGVRYVIIGHSERRWKLDESDAVVNKKLQAALRNGLTPIVCLGERTRDEGFADFLRQQTSATFAGLSVDDISRCLVAYEPVWAISTNPDARPDTPESARESMSIIREALGNSDVSILYGGSITSHNAADFLQQSAMRGVLVGGASVKKDEMVKILSIASKLS
jgi:triosephosphate isomerase